VAPLGRRDLLRALVHVEAFHSEAGAHHEFLRSAVDALAEKQRVRVPW
jgi:hypothetical protein